MPGEYCWASIPKQLAGLVLVPGFGSDLLSGGLLSPFHTAVQAKVFNLPWRAASCAILVVAPQAFLALMVPAHCFLHPHMEHL